MDKDLVRLRTFSVIIAVPEMIGNLREGRKAVEEIEPSNISETRRETGKPLQQQAITKNLTVYLHTVPTFAADFTGPVVSVLDGDTLMRGTDKRNQQVTPSTQSRPRLALALALVLLLIPSSVHAWAQEGHEILAILAEQRLHPDVRDALVALLEGTTFIEAASWADKVRNQQTAPWHYVNIDITYTEYYAARVCPQINV